MAWGGATISIYNKTGASIVTNNSGNTTTSIYEQYATVNDLLENYTNAGITSISSTIGGASISGDTVLRNIDEGMVYFYDVTPAEKVTGFYLDGTEYKIGGDEAIWGNISGTLSDQTDLQNALNSKQNTLTAGENIKISSNVISANNVFIITEDDVTVSTDDTKGVAPYNTSYGYTNIDISASAGIEWREGAIYTFVVDTEMVVASAYRNVRVKIGTGNYIPVMGTTTALSGSSYFTKTNIRQYQYSTKYEAGGALHLFTDSNTTYTAMSVAEGKTATATTVRGMRSDYLKQIIKYHSVDDTAYASSWNGVTDIAPSKNAVYDKIAAMDTIISGKQNTLATQTAYTSKGSATKVPQITTNTLGQVTGITEVDITHPSQVDDTAYASSWNGVTSTAPSKNAVYDKISAMDTTISGKQDALTAQTAYTSKGTSSKVPQITTNTLGQVTGITEVDISYPSQIDNTAYGSSWNGVTNKAPTKDAVYDKLNAIDGQIADLQAHGKFLSLWNSATGLPVSFPLTTPYTYSTGDYYMVQTLPSSGSKYMPNGSSYSGTASTTVDSANEVKVGDMYIYDGSTWLYASNHGKDVTFSNIAGNPTDNTNLATALNGKQDKLSAQTAYTSKGTASKVPQITTNTLGQVTGITEVDISYPSQVSDVAYASSWNGVTTVAPSKNVVYDKINAMDTTIAGKQDALTTQTAYTSKGTSTKVPTITTNTLGQVTGITETSIAFPVTSVNGNTGAITGLANASDVLTKTNTTSFTPTGDYQPATKKYVDDNKTEYNAGEGIAIGAAHSDMQGPAPTGYHVPLSAEREAVYNIWTALSGGTSVGANFGTALKMPKAGLRFNSSSSAGLQGTYGNYWSSTAYSADSAYCLQFTNSGIGSQIPYKYAYGFPIRCFKDSTVIPDTSWTMLYGTSIDAGGIFWNSTDGLISMSSNGTTWITMQDKNLGATQVRNSGDTLTESNCGGFFQWGNNYMFPFAGSVTTSSTQVDASSYGPGNYYSNSTFIIGNDNWSSVQNDNLWGGVTQGTWIGGDGNTIINTGVLSVNGQTGDVTIDTSEASSITTTQPSSPVEGDVYYDTTNDQLKVYDGNNWNVTGKEYNAGEGIEIGTIKDYSAMRGPCPEGFHVPLNTEWQAVYNVWTALGGGSSDGTNFGIALKLPFAGYRFCSSAGVGSQGSYGLYWSSSRNNTNNAYLLDFNSSEVLPQRANYRAFGYSVRCFKNSPTVPTSSWTKLYGTSIEAGGIFWSSTEGLISMSSDGQTWITIQDKNLGATTVWNSGDTLSEANCGKHYQRGNNYGFPRTGSVTTSSTQVDASTYGPGNYYSSSTFITRNSSPYRWDTTDNGNLWGGVTGVVTLDNAITNTGVTSVNGQTGNVTIEAFQLAPNSPLTPRYRRYGTQAQYDALTQYYTDEPGDTVYFTI